MRFGPVSSDLAIKSGLAAAGLLGVVIVVLLVKTMSGGFDVSSAFSLAVLFGLTAAGFAGFWLLKKTPEFSYFALAVSGGAFLFVAGFVAVFTIGLFVMPGAAAIITSAVVFLLAGDERLPIWRRVGIVLFGTVWILLFAAQLYGLAYLLNVRLPFLQS